MIAFSKVVARIQLNHFLVDVASLVTSRGLVMVISFLSGVMMARVLGPENKGIITALLVVPGLVQMFAELGLRQSTVYFLGKHIIDDQSAISTISLLALFISAAGMALVLLVYVLTGLPQRYGWEVTIIPLLLLPCSLITSYAGGVLMARRRIPAIAFISLLEPLVVLGLYGLLLASGTFFVTSVLWVMVTAAAVAAAYSTHLVQSYGSIWPRYLPGLPLRFVKLGFVYALALFVINLSYRIDVVLLERLSSSYEVGIYAVGVGLAQLLWLPSSALATANFAHSAASENASAHAQRTARILRLTVWCSVLPGIALYVVAPSLVRLVYGEAYAASGTVVRAILLGVWMDLIFKVLNSDLAGRGRPQPALWVSGLALAVNIVLNLWWIPSFGSIGAAWASSVSYTIGALIFAITYANMSGLDPLALLLPRRAEIHTLKSKLHV